MGGHRTHTGSTARCTSERWGRSSLIAGLVQATKTAPMYGVFPHPGPYEASTKTRIWMKGTVVQSPHSVHPAVNIPVRFVMLELAKQCRVWDDFKKLTENAEKAAKALTAIVHETKWSFGGMPLQNCKEEFFRKTTAELVFSSGGLGIFSDHS
eukprot:COSAG01_NODE_13735_length_1542_cov_6.726958_3_plen_153_part_00